MRHGRRGLVVAFALGALVVPKSTLAQPTTKVFRIGFISTSTTSVSSPLLGALRERLSELGYTEGKNIVFEYRFAESKAQLPDLSANLVKLPVDVILGGGSEGIAAAKAATRTIPIVMTNSGDAVREGFVASLARPGGNITGLTQISPELAGKRLQLLKDILPRMSRVAVLWHPLHPNTPFTFKETQVAANQLRLQVMSLEVTELKDVDEAFVRAATERAEALVVLRDPFTVRHRALIADIAARSRLPAIYETGDYVKAGGLMFYGPDFADLFRRAAGFVDRILRGAKPADLPVEQPTKFELVVNLKTARAMGLTIPPAVLARADEVIQ
jgi:putative ABC transport system substrate-binding protein